MSYDLPDSFQLEKFKFINDTVTVHYTYETEQGGDAPTKQKFEDPIHPDLRDALQALDGPVAIMTELHLNEWRQKNPITIKGFTLKRKDGQTLITITGVRALDKHPGTITINTPKRVLPIGEDDTIEGDLDRKLVARYNALREEILKYLGGKRLQLSLEFDDEGEPEGVEAA